MSERYPRESCYICDFDTAELLEKHHIVPQRYGGGDLGGNVVHLCPRCHEALERLYGDEFYSALGLEQGDSVEGTLQAAKWLYYRLHELEVNGMDGAATAKEVILSEYDLTGIECNGCEMWGPYKQPKEGKVECLNCGTLSDATEARLAEVVGHE